MNNAYSLFRSLIIYGICLPLAIFLGYLLSDPLDLTTLVTVALLMTLLMTPILLKWHYPWLILAWNSSAGLYFLPGKPSLGFALILISLSISVLSYIMNRNSTKFIPVPSVAWSLVFIAFVMLGTAKLTGGLGLNMLGSSNIGGKRYVLITIGILGFFALTARRIPANKVKLYVDLFYLGALSSAIGELAAVAGPSFSFIYLMFPAGSTAIARNEGLGEVGMVRLGGLAVSSIAVISLMLARYGLGGILNSGKPMRKALFFLCIIACMLGGFRSMVITLLLMCGILFYLEGLMKSRLLPVTIIVGLLLAAFTVAFANKLPVTIQRSLTFLPLDLSDEAEGSAKASSAWRLEMWADVIPTIPKYLILGKGYSMDLEDFDMMARGLNRGEISAYGSEMAGDYHNGPLSVIIPFGILGAIGFLWFLYAGFRVLQRNYLYGDPSLVTFNRFLLTIFIVKIIVFFFIFGAFEGDLGVFIGEIGFSVALNGGVCSPALEPVKRPVLNRFKLVGATR